MLVLASDCPSIPSRQPESVFARLSPCSLRVYLPTKATMTFENTVVIIWQLDSPDTLSVTYTASTMIWPSSPLTSSPNPFLWLLQACSSFLPLLWTPALGPLHRYTVPRFFSVGSFQTSLQITAIVTSRPFPASPIAPYDIILTYFFRKFLLTSL